METAFAWLNQLMSWMGRWVPRLILIPPTHRGVRFGPRGGTKQTGPGLVVYWPMTHSLLQVPITTQSFQLCPQVLPSEERAAANIPCAMICGAAIQFRVVDAVKAATSVLHFHALVDNRSQAALAKHFNPSDKHAWTKAAVEELRVGLSPFGIYLEQLDFTQGATGIALKNISEWTYADSTNGSHVLSDNR